MNNNLENIVNFIWGTANLIRDVYKKSKFADVILPFTILRRLDCVLEPTKNEVLQKYAQYATDEYDQKLPDPSNVLESASGYKFYNTSKYTFEILLEDPNNIKDNFKNYLNGFSPNIQEIIERFDLDTQIKKLASNNLLYKVIERFAGDEIDLHPESLSNHQMGYIFEELIRRFNEQSNENPGDHFTPREVIELMVNILMSKDQDELSNEGKIVTVYDPACGSGGMLTVAKEHILKDINPKANVKLYGQEINDETYAICKSDMIIKGEDEKNIKFGSSFSKDGLPKMEFDYILSNPPYGKEWKLDKEFIKDENKRGSAGRFMAGLPNIGDGQLLFLQHMISKMHPEEKTRIAIVFNGAPLFTAEAGGGESEIRRWIIENDWLETIIAMPDQLFYNTGIYTYIWLLTNKKEKEKKEKITLIKATDFYEKMPKSFGKKRHKIKDWQISKITELYLENAESKDVKVFDSSDFGYRRIVIDQPLRMNFINSEDRIRRLSDQTTFQNLIKPGKKVKNKDNAIKEGKIKQKMIIKALKAMPNTIYYDYEKFESDLVVELKKVGVNPLAGIKKAIRDAIGVIDEKAKPIVDSKGNLIPDVTNLRFYEKVPLKEDIYEYFDREVAPYVHNAWISEQKDHRDPKDGEIGKIGYEINFNQYFFTYEPPRTLEEINQDLKNVQKEILDLLGEVTK